MPTYISGTAAWIGIVVDGDNACPRHKILPGAFDGFDWNSPVAILREHSWLENLGSTQGNAKLWLEGSKVKFCCLLKDHSAAEKLRADYLAGLVRGCSIRASGWSRIEYDDNGRPYIAFEKILTITDVGPVSVPRNKLCSGLKFSDRPELPNQLVRAAGVKPLSVSVKRPKRIISLPAMPQAMKNGMLIAAAAESGQGVKIGAITLSAESVQTLIRNRAHAIL